MSKKGGDTGSAPARSSKGRVFIYGLLIFLFIIHHDYVFWGLHINLFGLPIALFYDMFYTVLCAIAWYLAIRLAWPDELEAFADEEDAEPESEASA